MGQVVGWTKPRPRMWTWVGAELFALGHWGYHLRWGAEPVLQGPYHWGQLSTCCNQLSHGEVAPFLLQCPVRGRASYPGTSDGQGWLNMALGFQHAWFL